MKLEVGKFYRTRDGKRVVGPIRAMTSEENGGMPSVYGFAFDECTPTELWTLTGAYYFGKVCNNDLISECDAQGNPIQKSCGCFVAGNASFECEAHAAITDRAATRSAQHGPAHAELMAVLRELVGEVQGLREDLHRDLRDPTASKCHDTAKGAATGRREWFVVLNSNDVPCGIWSSHHPANNYAVTKSEFVGQLRVATLREATP